MTDIRADILAMHLDRQKLTDHQVAAALSCRVEGVRMALAGMGWFTEAGERRLREWLELPRDEFEVAA